MLLHINNRPLHMPTPEEMDLFNVLEDNEEIRFKQIAALCKANGIDRNSQIELLIAQPPCHIFPMLKYNSFSRYASWSLVVVHLDEGRLNYYTSYGKATKKPQRDSHTTMRLRDLDLVTNGAELSLVNKINRKTRIFKGTNEIDFRQAKEMLMQAISFAKGDLPLNEQKEVTL